VSFGTALKGIRLAHGRETELFTHDCTPDEAPCAMNHFWCGGTFPHYLDTRLRYYVDGDEPVVVPLGLAHGMSSDFEQFDVPYSVNLPSYLPCTLAI
jgi:hypothetical protein